MTRVYGAGALEALATFWRIYRRDGAALGFTTHDRDLRFAGLLHRAAPGMVPSAIRRTGGLDDDAGDVTGALSHDAITASDLASGRYDGARIVIGVVDWESLQHKILYRGAIGDVASEGASFEVSVRSDKAALGIDSVPRTSPTCRARFCDADCGLGAAAYTHEGTVADVDHVANAVRLAGLPAAARFDGGELRWIDGPQIGRRVAIHRVEGDFLILGEPLDTALVQGMRASVREGCDHTIATCTGRFANSVNFRGEPFLPGNDVLIRYPTGASQ